MLDVKAHHGHSGKPTEVLYGLALHTTDPQAAIAEATDAWRRVYDSTGGDIDSDAAADLARLAAVINELEARSNLGK